MCTDLFLFPFHTNLVFFFFITLVFCVNLQFSFSSAHKLWIKAADREPRCERWTTDNRRQRVCECLHIAVCIQCAPKERQRTRAVPPSTVDLSHTIFSMKSTPRPLSILCVGIKPHSSTAFMSDSTERRKTRRKMKDWN